MKMSRGLIDHLIELLSSAIVREMLTDLDKRLRTYVTDMIHKILKRIILTIAGLTLTMVGIIFLLVSSAIYLSEHLHSTWMGCGIVGIIIVIAGLILYAASHR